MCYYINDKKIYPNNLFRIVDGKEKTMKNSKKTEEVKTTATAAASKTAVKAEPKTETKAAAVKTTAAKKPTAKKAEPAKKAATTKKTTTKTAAAKTNVKTTAKKTEAAPKAAAKKTKPPVTIDTICEKLGKKINKTKAAAIKKTIAVDIEVYEFEDGSNQKMYVEVKDGNVTVAPHSYDDKNFRVAISFANAVAFVNGKITLATLLDSDKFYAEGNIVDAIKLSAIF